MENLISKKNLNIWADYLLNYSLGGISKDDIVMVKGEKICWPLISVIQDKIFEAGAIADINLIPPDNERGIIWGASMTKHGSAEQIKKVPQWQIDRYENMTKYIEILGNENPEFFNDQNDELVQEIMKFDQQLKNIRLAKPWVLTLFPTKSFAEMEDMSLEDYTNIIVKASTINPQYLEEIEEDLYQLMDRSKIIRIQTEHPDTKKLLELSISITDNLIMKSTGKRNFPDGEIFTSPDANSVKGEIFVDLPIFQGGSLIQGIYLKFENGKIIDYNAKVGNETLSKIIETDEGSHRLGEVALGMNNGIERALKHPLFVEKLGGTLHIAIGASYQHCYRTEKKSLDELVKDGVINVSAQHVDIVADFRSGGVGRAVYLDDVKLEQKDNIWIVPTNS